MNIHYVNQFRHISISCLENNSGRSIDSHIAEWLELYDEYQYNVIKFGSQSVWIGGKYKQRDVIYINSDDYRPIKWRCPSCNNWNYELTFCDNSGATACCDECDNFLEF